MLGLALSAVAKSNDQIMPLLVVAVMSQLVFSGGMIPVTARIGLDQMSWATPATLGLRGVSLYRRSDQTGAGPIDPEGFALASQCRHLVVRHGHAGCDQRRLSGLRALEDSPQGRRLARQRRLRTLADRLIGGGVHPVR